MTATCPSCYQPQGEGLLCTVCTSRLTTDLRGNASIMGVAELVDNLHVAMAKQARINGGSNAKPRPRPKTAEGEDGNHKLAHERLPINLGAAAALADLESYLGTWAMDVTNDQWWPERERWEVARAVTKGDVGPFHDRCGHPSCERMRMTWRVDVDPIPVQAADALLDHMPEIRRHGAVAELVDELTKVITKARRVIDRPVEMRYVGPCLAPVGGGQCGHDLYIGPGATTVRCTNCGKTHEVANRPADLLDASEDHIVTVREASQYIGYFGGMAVNQKTIRTWIDRGVLSTRLGPTEERHIRLGDLYDVLAKRAEKATTRGAA